MGWCWEIPNENKDGQYHPQCRLPSEGQNLSPTSVHTPHSRLLQITASAAGGDLGQPVWQEEKLLFWQRKWLKQGGVVGRWWKVEMWGWVGGKRSRGCDDQCDLWMPFTEGWGGKGRSPDWWVETGKRWFSALKKSTCLCVPITASGHRQLIAAPGKILGI